MYTEKQQPVPIVKLNIFTAQKEGGQGDTHFISLKMLNKGRMKNFECWASHSASSANDN